METWDAIRARRNVRSFENRPIPDEDLDRILEAGRRSASAANWQPWDFVVVTDRNQLRELSTVWRGASHVARAAAAIALVADMPDNERRLAYDLGQVTVNIMLAATDLGIGSSHANVGDQETAQRVLGLPAGKRCFYLISLGYPADRPLAPLQRPNRRPFADVVHRDRW
jgi:nitroreductase